MNQEHDLSKLIYKNPKDWLIKLSFAEQLAPLVVRKKPRLLDKRSSERRQAGLFAYGMSCLLKREVGFAMYENEDSDIDFVAKFIDDDLIKFVPVQLKEWVPAGLNPAQSLESIYSNLKQYEQKGRITVAIYVCRNVQLEMKEIRLHNTNFSSVWLYGSYAPGLWFLWGDVQSEDPAYFEFEYPRS